MNTSDVRVDQWNDLMSDGYILRLTHIPTDIFLEDSGPSALKLMEDMTPLLRELVDKRENPSPYAYC